MGRKAAKESTPTSATGISTSIVSRPRSASAGFSLLELLVVVTIIAIFAGASILSIGIVGRDREIEREVLRLRSLIELLQEEALLQSRDYGILFSARGYRFYVYDYQQAAWVQPIADNFLQEHQLTGPLRLELTLEDRSLELPEELPSPQTVDSPRPQVAILASGELTPFEIEVYREIGGGRFNLTAGLDGSFEVSREGFDAG